jgi:hypothetical protein
MRSTAMGRIASAHKRRRDPITPQVADLLRGEEVREALLPALFARDRCGPLGLLTPARCSVELRVTEALRGRECSASLLSDKPTSTW